MIRIAKYKHSRFWAVYRGEELLAVVVYKVGALAVAALARGENRRLLIS